MYVTVKEGNSVNALAKVTIDGAVNVVSKFIVDMFVGNC